MTSPATRSEKNRRGSGVRDGKAKPTLAFVEDCARVFSLRAAGATFRSIATQLDISPATAHRRYQAVLDHARPDAETIEQVRARQLEEVRVAREKMMQNVIMKADPRSARTLEGLWRHELALLGARAEDFEPPRPAADASSGLAEAVAEQILAAQLAALGAGETDDDVAEAEIVD